MRITRDRYATSTSLSSILHEHRSTRKCFRLDEDDGPTGPWCAVAERRPALYGIPPTVSMRGSMRRKRRGDTQASNSHVAEDSKSVRSPRHSPRCCLMDEFVTRQSSGQQYASKLPRYFSLFIALATAFSLYLVSSPFSVVHKPSYKASRAVFGHCRPSRPSLVGSRRWSE